MKTDADKEAFQELLQSGAYNGDKTKINNWWKELSTKEQVESGLAHMAKQVGKYKEKQEMKK